MRPFLLLLCLVSSLFSPLLAQSTREIRELEAKRTELQQQLAESETLLQSTKSDVKSQLDNLALITGQLAERKSYIQAIEKEVKLLNQELNGLERQLTALERNLKEKRQKYDSSLQYMRRNKTVQERLLFILSAENLNQTYRRMRYVHEYANYQRLQANEIERKQEQVVAKREEIKRTKGAKELLLKQGEEEKKKIEGQEQERKELLASLQKKQKGIQNEMAKNRRSAQQLNAKIDQLIEIEIEKARKRAEEEARRKAAAKAEAERKAKVEADRKAKEAAKREADRTKGTTGKGETGKEKPAVEPAKEVVKKVAPVENYKLDSEDRTLSSNFESNRGSLPIPITGPYVVVSRYGQYAVDGLRNVQLDNKGIDFKGKAGAEARAIFAGEVSAVFQYNGMSNVLIRHGSYISVYCNLSKVHVTKGSKVDTRQSIGTIHTDVSGNTVLHFQLRKETTKLNPESWLKR
ncbi:MAG: murein hydrolase activator EnvC family protein [Phocaeicola sp.]